jgi:hypothetical protein
MWLSKSYLVDTLTKCVVSKLRGQVPRAIPVTRPLPHVADHVVEAVAVRLEAADRGGRGVAVLVRIVDGEDTLPGIGDRLAFISCLGCKSGQALAVTRFDRTADGPDRSCVQKAYL